MKFGGAACQLPTILIVNQENGNERTILHCIDASKSPACPYYKLIPVNNGHPLSQGDGPDSKV